VSNPDSVCKVIPAGNVPVSVKSGAGYPVLVTWTLKFDLVHLKDIHLKTF